MPEFAPILNVSSLNGSSGFRLDGDAVNDLSGRATAGGGDVNGDGFTDLLIGPLGGPGRAWVVFGAATSPASQTLGSRVAAGTAYGFQGESAYDQIGFAVANAGDVNGDGFDDLIIGARYGDPDGGNNRGAGYLVLGGTAKLEALDAADASNDNLIALANLGLGTGYRFDGVADLDQAGYSISGAGDVNGDGIADLLIGALFADPNTSGYGEGASYLVFGGNANLSDLDDNDGVADGRIDLALIGAGNGLRLDGPSIFAAANSGASVALVGDVNGDGFDDALIGAPFDDPNSVNSSEGAAYLVFGRPQAQFTSVELELANPNGLAMTRFDGEASLDQVGKAVNGLGDVNGDGFADIVIGAPFAGPSSGDTGSAYVVFGRSAFGNSSDLAALNGSNGFRLDGVRIDDRTGLSVSGAGDVNGDGFADILVGAYGFDRLAAPNTGAAYVVFGKASRFAAVLDLASLNGDNGFRIEGAAATDFFGLGAMGAAGDVNKDGFDDIVVGAFLADNNALSSSGSTYVIYGHRAETDVVRTGTALDNRINGGTGDDVVAGLGGNDTLLGWEGSDDISGGGGDDIIIMSEGFDAINAGSGKDTLDFRTMPGSTSLDMAAGAYTFLASGEEGTFSQVEQVTMSNGNDIVTGSTRNDIIIAAKGNDTVNGGAGNDFIAGNYGRDTLTGGLGVDRFDYNQLSESTTNVNIRDTITDFLFNVDKIDLSTLDAQAGTGGNQAFTAFIGAAAFSAEGQIRAFQSVANTIVEINTSGATGAEMQIVLANFTAANLDLGDFVA